MAVCLCWQYSRIIYFKPEINSPEWIFHNFIIFYLEFIFFYLCCMRICFVCCCSMFLSILSFYFHLPACMWEVECLFCALWEHSLLVLSILYSSFISYPLTSICLLAYVMGTDINDSPGNEQVQMSRMSVTSTGSFLNTSDERELIGETSPEQKEVLR